MSWTVRILLPVVSERLIERLSTCTSWCRSPYGQFLSRIEHHSGFVARQQTMERHKMALGAEKRRNSLGYSTFPTLGTAPSATVNRKECRYGHRRSLGAKSYHHSIDPDLHKHRDPGVALCDYSNPFFCKISVWVVNHVNV